MSTPREGADAQRQAKLRSIGRQIKSGKLVVRQMTPVERAQHPPAPSGHGQSGRS